MTIPIPQSNLKSAPIVAVRWRGFGTIRTICLFVICFVTYLISIDDFAEPPIDTDRLFIGEIVIADTVRPEARRAVDALTAMRMRVILLTGDISPVASAVAHDIGINEFEAHLLPEQKLARVRDLVSRGRIVAMLGDGINDAPARSSGKILQERSLLIQRALFSPASAS
jgi:soluble P-type ATPase